MHSKTFNLLVIHKGKVVPLVNHHSADWNNISFFIKMMKANNWVPYEMIIADHDFCQENKETDNVDKEHFRTENSAQNCTL